MTARYLLCPGEVRSGFDGDWHHVGSAQLAALYGVPMAECVVLPSPTPGDRTRAALLSRADTGDLVSLRPRADGDYRLPRPRVINRRRSLNMPDGAVYIGRPSRWGNPFEIGRHGDRAAVVARFREWLLAQPDLVAAVRRDLAGRDLVCFCAPAACHGDVLLEVANAPAPQPAATP